MPRQFGEHPRQGGRIGRGDCHANALAQEEIAAGGAFQFYVFVFEEEPGLAQQAEIPGGIKRDRKIHAQAQTLVSLGEQPENEAILQVRVHIQQPAALFIHVSTRSTRVLRFHLFQFLPQDRDLLGLFEENCQQGGLEGQQRLGLTDGSDVPACGGEETIEDVLVASAQGAAEGRQQTLGLVEMLGDGEDGTSHSVKCEVSGGEGEEGRLRGERRHICFGGEDFISAGADLFNEEGAVCREWRGKGDDDRGGQSQAVDLPQAGFQEAVCFMYRDMVIVEGVQQIEDQTGLMQRGSIRQQGIHFIAGESAPDEKPIRGGGYVHRFSPEQMRDAIRNEAISAIQHSDRAAQGEFGGETRALVSRGVRSVENDQTTSLKSRQEFHDMRIIPARRNKQPPPG